jgi:hypothetical protein
MIEHICILMSGINFINPTNNRTFGSKYAALYDMRDKLPKPPTKEIWEEVYTKLPFTKFRQSYQPVAKTFYIGGTGSKSSVNTTNNIEKLRAALRKYDDDNNNRTIVHSEPPCYYFIDRHTREKYRIPCSLAKVLEDASKISKDPYYKNMVVIEETEIGKMIIDITNYYETQKEYISIYIDGLKNKMEELEILIRKELKNHSNLLKKFKTIATHTYEVTYGSKNILYKTMVDSLLDIIRQINYSSQNLGEYYIIYNYLEWLYNEKERMQLKYIQLDKYIRDGGTIGRFASKEIEDFKYKFDVNRKSPNKFSKFAEEIDRMI